MVGSIITIIILVCLIGYMYTGGILLTPRRLVKTSCLWRKNFSSYSVPIRILICFLEVLGVALSSLENKKYVI
jgi:hypothetical protein